MTIIICLVIIGLIALSSYFPPTAKP